jgi:hypothetical protein
MNHFCVISLLITAGFSLVGFSQTYTTYFEEAENPLSEHGRWVNHGLDWTQIRKTNGIASGTQVGTNTGIYKFDDSYTHLSGFPPDQEAWGQAHISKLNAPCIQELEFLLRWTSSAHRTTGYECFARCVDERTVPPTPRALSGVTKLADMVVWVSVSYLKHDNQPPRRQIGGLVRADPGEEDAVGGDGRAVASVTGMPPLVDSHSMTR